MPNYSNLGKVFHDFRTNKNISLKQIADKNVSISQLSRFENGTSDLSVTKFFHALDNMKVGINEFIGYYNGENQSDTISFMSQLVPLEYKRDLEGFKRLYDEQNSLYQNNPTNYQYHLNMILAQSFICKCDNTIPFPDEYMREIADYLFSIEEWNMYEIILIGNLYLFMDTSLLHRMGQEVLRYYGKNRTNKPVTRITLLNIYETFVYRNALKEADFYKNEIPKIIEDETLLYERNIYLFLTGLLHYKSGKKLQGQEEMEHAIQIYEWLHSKNLATNYRNDFIKHT